MKQLTSEPVRAINNPDRVWVVGQRLAGESEERLSNRLFLKVKESPVE